MTDEPTESAFERAILGHEPTLTAEEVAERSGLTLDQARRLWRTLGFPDRGADRAFTESDVDAMSTISGILDDGLMDFDVALNVTRGIGLSMARLADWEVGALIQRADALYAARDEAADESSSLSPAARLTREYGERFEELLMYSWRRHLIAALGRMESARAIEDVPGTTNLTVGFADIVGFTSLSNEVSRARIGDIVETFESRCGDVIASKSGRLIKAIGDAVLFVNDDPYLAFQTAEGIINVIGRDQRMPDVRVGLATGSVVLRLGDVFGPPVNMASRLTQVARRNRIIVDQDTADLLPEDQIESRRLPARPVRGFGVVEPVAVRRP
ncbi:MAG: adenylate/guanylate cyclase domain-containing protein [Nocardioidaceae bacterium]|nr:adenylate/guanylate cyclase domain-containing protein [Nocardioidaceae bacterium]MCL2614890.1 adenylate/guanylate cyclase domain-containing protein [Nocardioidaceae bacterium]